MTILPIKEEMPDVPVQIFTKFLEALQDAGVSAELVARLRKALLTDKKFSEQVLKDCVLPEEKPS